MSQDLFDAVRRGDAARVDTLVSADESLARSVNDEGVSVVLWSRYVGEPVIGERLRALAGDLDVFTAAGIGDHDRIRTLLAGDASLVSAYAGDGFTALHLAAFFDHPAVAELLIAAGADVSAVARQPMAVQPLHSAAAGQSLDVSRQLVAAGADVNARQQGGFTPLHAAAQHGQLELVRLLLDAGADPAALTDDRRTARDLAPDDATRTLLG